MLKTILVTESSAGFPLGLGCVKAFADADSRLRGKAAVSIEYVDDISRPDAAAALRPAVAGFSTYGDPGRDGLRRLFAGCARLKALNKDLRIVLGGPAVSCMKMGELFACGAVDFAVRGEGEITFSELLLELSRGGGGFGKIPGLIFRRDGEILENPERPPAADPSVFPSPFLSGALDLSRHAGVFIEGSRGCASACKYCAMNARGLRYFGEARVLAEVRHILATAPRTRQIAFVDNDLLADRGRAARLLAKAADAAAGTTASFMLVSGPYGLNAEILPARSREKFCVITGLQSLNPAALAESGRPRNAALLKRNIARFRRDAPSSKLLLDVIYGLPGDDLRGFMSTLDWAISTGAALVLYHLRVLEGTYFGANRAALKLRREETYPYYAISTPAFGSADMRRAGKLVSRVKLITDNLLREPLITEFILRLGERLSGAVRFPHIHVCVELARFMKRTPEFDRLLADWDSGADSGSGPSPGNEYRARLIGLLLSFSKKLLARHGRSAAGPVLERLARAAVGRLLFNAAGRRRKEAADRYAGGAGKVLLVCWADSCDHKFLPHSEVLFLRDRFSDEAQDPGRAVPVELSQARLALPAKSRFDLIILSGVLSSFPEKDRAGFLRKLRGLARAEGELLVFDHLGGSPGGAETGKEATETAFVSLLKTSGWPFVRLTPCSRAGDDCSGESRLRIFLASKRASRDKKPA